MAKKNSAKLQALTLVGQVGYTVAIPLLVFIALGAFLDDRLSTGPLFLLLGLALGMLVSFYSLYRLLKPFLSS